MAKNQGVITGNPAFDFDWGEANTRLTGTQKFSEYREMWRTDPQVKNAFDTATMPIRRAKWSVEFGEKVSEDVIETIVKPVERVWDRILDRALKYMLFGVYAFEMEYKTINSRAILTNMYSRHPITWDEQGFKYNSKGEIKKISVSGYSGNNYVTVQDIPVERLLLMTHDIEGESDMHGTSLLRPAYGYYYFKRKILTLFGIWCERSSFGVPMFFYKPGQDKAELETALNKVMSHKSNYMLIPENLVKRDAIEILQPNKDAGKNLLDAIKELDQQVAKISSSQFLTLGSTQSGSRSVGETIAEQALKQAQAKAEDMAAMLKEQVVDRLLRINYGENAPEAKVVVTGIVDMDSEKLSGYLSAMVSAGVISPDEDLEDFARERGALPPANREKLKQSPKTEPVKDDPEQEDEGDENEDTALSDASCGHIHLSESEPHPFSRFMRLSEMTASRDDLETEVKQSVELWRQDSIKRISSFLDGPLQDRNVGKIGQLRILNKQDLVRILAEAGERAQQLGLQEVQDEASAQLAELGILAEPSINFNEGGAISDEAQAAIVSLEAQNQAEEIAQELQTQAITGALASVDEEEPSLDTVVQRLQDSGEINKSTAAATIVGVGIGAGRKIGLSKPIFAGGNTYNYREFIRLELLDANTCGPCTSIDGKTTTLLSENIQGPYSGCAGRGRCRGTVVGVLETEAA